MDMKRIGGFLKALRKEKGLTQEQLAEALLVSSKTVSRWETGTNLPELSILLQIAAFYEVEVKEILDGERQPVPASLEETLDKVADYSRLHKEQAAQTGNIAFALTFAVCAATLLIQLALGVRLTAVLGETVTLFAGGVAYIGMMLYRGLGEQSASSGELLIGLLCSAGATVVFALRSAHMGVPPERLARMAILFFAGIMLLGFGLMKVMAILRRKRNDPD